MGHTWRKMWASCISSKCGHRWPGPHELEINTPHEIIWMRYLNEQFSKYQMLCGLHKAENKKQEGSGCGCKKLCASMQDLMIIMWFHSISLHFLHPPSVSWFRLFFGELRVYVMIGGQVHWIMCRTLTTNKEDFLVKMVFWGFVDITPCVVLWWEIFRDKKGGMRIILWTENVGCNLSWVE